MEADMKIGMVDLNKAYCLVSHIITRYDILLMGIQLFIQPRFRTIVEHHYQSVEQPCITSHRIGNTLQLFFRQCFIP